MNLSSLDFMGNNQLTPSAEGLDGVWQNGKEALYARGQPLRCRYPVAQTVHFKGRVQTFQNSLTF